jgi:hypothetical protein
MPAKRFWSGQLDEQKIFNEVHAWRPDVILLTSDAEYSAPWNDFLGSEYRQVYEDRDSQLYVLKSIAGSVLKGSVQ